VLTMKMSMPASLRTLLPGWSGDVDAGIRVASSTLERRWDVNQGPVHHGYSGDGAVVILCDNRLIVFFPG
jgi:hypothetical protein